MCSRFALALLLFSPLVAQTVLHVGPGGYAQIGDAIAAASPNDIVEVAAGNYFAFTLDKPLVITALPAPVGQIVQVIGASMLSPSITDLRPPAGTRAYLTNIHFRNPWLTLWKHSVQITRGTVCCEECTFEGVFDGIEPGLRTQNATVQLRHCLILGSAGASLSATGLIATNSDVFAADCFVHGGDLGIKANMPGGNGISATNSLLHLVGTDVVAGNSNGITCVSNWPAGHGVLLQGTSTAWIADCTVRGGDGYCRAGGDALRNLTPTPVQLARTTLLPGSGTPPGQASLGPTTPTALLGLTGGTVGLTRGQPWQVQYRTEPFWPVTVLLASDVLVQSSPFVAERLLLPLPNASTFTLLLASANGDAVLQTSVPAVAILQHQRAFLQAFSGLALPVHTMPALGGVIR